MVWEELVDRPHIPWSRRRRDAAQRRAQEPDLHMVPPAQDAAQPDAGTASAVDADPLAARGSGLEPPTGPGSQWPEPAAAPRSDDRERRPPVDAGGAPVHRRRHDEIEQPVPAAEQLRRSARHIVQAVRRSVPLRTVLFLLPPLVLPALGFDLTLGAALVVALLLLWLAVAAGLLATMMFEGSDQVALRAIERRLEALDGDDPTRTGTHEALMAVGGQLDRLGDRIDQLDARIQGATQRADPRPAEHWSAAPKGEQYDRYDQQAAPARQWSDPGWQRPRP